MATISINQVIRIPSVHSKFERSTNYIVGCFVGGAFWKKCVCDEYSLAVQRCISLQEANPDSHFHIIENRSEQFLIL